MIVSLLGRLRVLERALASSLLVAIVALVVGASAARYMGCRSREVLSLQALQQPALVYALSGGEDYELLFTVPPEKAGRLRSLRQPVTEIGLIVKGSGMKLLDKDGRRTPLTVTGHDHVRPGGAMQGQRR